jgi:hypothetical protein
METRSPRTWLGVVVVGLVLTLFVTVTGWLLASPSQDIAAAVSSSGARSVKDAKPDQYLNAVASVLAGVDRKRAALYVAAAVQARPDLKDSIMATAAEMSADEAGGDGSDKHVSKHRRMCTICHNGHVTLTLPCKAAREHLEHHPRDTKGPCPTPTPHV